jgi:hypothetical protein
MSTPSESIDRLADPAPAGSTDVPQFTVRLTGILFLLAAAILAYLLTAFWPVKGGANDDWYSGVTLFGWSFTIATEVRLIWLVIIAAALGSYVHTVTSFASYVGNRRLHRSWLWWYVLRTPIGVCLALVFYFVVRAGFFSSGALGKDISPFGVAALSGMVGMFSKQATDKLREVFDNLFRTAPGKGDDAREDKLATVPLVIEKIEPDSVQKGGAGFSLRVRGKGFVEGCCLVIGGKQRATQLESSTELTGAVTPEDVAAAGVLEVAVLHPGPPERRSNTGQLRVTEPEGGASAG